MNSFIGKKGLITFIAVVISAFSITMLDFENLEWNNNVKSYVGLIVMLVLVLSSLFMKAEETAEENE